MSTPMIDRPVPDRWATVRPEEVAPFFLAASVPWWIAGGWALDLFLGRQTREHRDLEAGVLRQDCARLLAALRGWEIFEARNGVLSRLLAVLDAPAKKWLRESLHVMQPTHPWLDFLEAQSHN